MEQLVKCEICGEAHTTLRNLHKNFNPLICKHQYVCVNCYSKEYKRLIEIIELDYLGRLNNGTK